MIENWWRIVIPALLILMMAPASPVMAADEFERATLAGLAGVYVIVEEIQPDAEQDGLNRATLQTDIELKLRQAGVTVLGKDQMPATPGRPILHLIVDTRKSFTGLYAYHIRLELAQIVVLARNPLVATLAATWRSRNAVGIVGAAKLSQVRGTVRDFVDEFINDYLAANPKR